MQLRPLEFGWFLPTGGDTITYGSKDGIVPPSMALFEKIALAAESAGFEYLLVPVATACWDAYISSAMVLARTRSIRMLVAARPGYVTPVLLARMLGAMDRLSEGRVAVNLIAGQSDEEALQDGILLSKQDRYAQMEEDVAIMKALWSQSTPLHYEGRFHHLQGARSVPRPRMAPRFYLGGGSQQAWELSAKHSDVHLFWGDTVETIASNIAAIRKMAATHGRADDIAFGMRLQIICRETEQEAWDAAEALLAGVTEADTDLIRKHYASSEANQRVQELARIHGELIAPHLWTGITRVRPGAGIVVVGNPQQCADTLQQFIDIGCDSFCLSGYLHDEEARRFAKMVRPILARANPGRVPEMPQSTY